MAGAGGRDGRYLVTWTDPVAIGAPGFGLLLELERQGFDVGVTEAYGTGAVEHRVMGLDEATGQVDLVIGQAGIDDARRRPGAVEVATADIRSEADIERYEELKAEVTAELEAIGAQDIVPALDAAIMARGHRPPGRHGDPRQGGGDGRHRRPGGRVRHPALTDRRADGKLPASHNSW